MRTINLSSKLAQLIMKAMLPLIVIIVLIFIISHYLDFKKVIQNLDKIPVYGYAGILMLSLSSYIFRAIRWLLFVNTNKNPQQINLPWKKHFLIYFSGFALTMSPGKLGELLRSKYLYDNGIKISVSIISFITERVWDVIIVLSLSLLYLYQFLPLNIIYITAILPLMIIAIMQTSLIPILLYRIKKFRFIYINLKIVKTLWTFPICLKSIVLTSLAWLCQGIAFYYALHLLGYHLPITIMVGIYCTSLLAGAISMIPSGIGVTEATMSVMLIYMGIPEDIAILVSLISRILTLWFAIILGISSMIKLELTSNSKSDN